MALEHRITALALASVLALGLGCGKTETLEVAMAPETIATGADALQAETRAKLVALAVEAECLRKRDVPPDESADRMMALFKAQAIDLETYTREMSQLAGDPAFRAEVDEKTLACPTLPGNDTVNQGDVAVDTGPDATADTALAPDTTPTPDTAEAPDTAIQAVDTVVADTAKAAVEDTLAVPETTTPDTRIADAVISPRDVITQVPVPVPEADYSGNWMGQIRGVKPTGVLRMTISEGRRITSAVATFGRITIRLKGSISEKGVIALGGVAGADSMRMNGTTHSNGRVINGSWDGTIDKRKTSGRVQIKR